MISQDGISYPHPTSSTSINEFAQDNNYLNPSPNPNPNPDNTSSSNKRKRSLPGNPDPDAEVVALSPRSLMATNRFICEVCNKGFQREQNLQLHRRGHNLPWKLKQKSKESVRKKVYLCPEKSCVHHDPSRALGDLTGIKKHFSRKHGEKKWKCEKCSKKYAVMSDWKAHSKICGTREYKCDCGTIFSRKDSFITHRAFCDALTEERMRVNGNLTAAAMNPNFRVDMINGSFISTPQSVARISPFSTSHRPDFLSFESSSSGTTNNVVDSLNKPRLPLWFDHANPQSMNSHHLEVPSNGTSHFLASSDVGRAGHVLPEFPTSNLNLFSPPSRSITQGGILKNEEETSKSNYTESLISLYSSQPPPQSSSPTACSMSATALLQKAAQIGSTRSDNNSTVFANTAGMMRTTSSNSLSNNHMASVATNDRRDLFRQEANRHQLVGVEHHQGYSAADQLMMMGASIGDNGSIGTGGMRDFLGTMGGAAGRGNVSNDDSNGGRSGGGDQRRVVLQDEMAYKMATMAAGGGGSHQQEPYMNLMR